MAYFDDVNFIEKNLIGETYIQSTIKSTSANLGLHFLKVLYAKRNYSSESIKENDKVEESNTTQPFSLIFNISNTQLLSELNQDEVVDNESDYNAEINESVKLLSRALIEFDYDEDTPSDAEKLIISISKEKSLRFLGEVVQRIYLACNDNDRALVGICVSLERFSNNEVMPWGLTMLIGLLNHKSVRVKEAALSLIDNWESIDLLPVLRNLECKSDWMQDYVNAVVHRLEEAHVSNKKAV